MTKEDKMLKQVAKEINELFFGKPQVICRGKRFGNKFYGRKGGLK